MANIATAEKVMGNTLFRGRPGIKLAANCLAHRATGTPMARPAVAIPSASPRWDEKGWGNGEVSSAWANRVQPANSKGGNRWQSPLCGAHTDRHFRESPGYEETSPARERWTHPPGRPGWSPWRRVR